MSENVFPVGLIILAFLNALAPSVLLRLKNSGRVLYSSFVYADSNSLFIKGKLSVLYLLIRLSSEEIHCSNPKAIKN